MNLYDLLKAIGQVVIPNAISLIVKIMVAKNVPAEQVNMWSEILTAALGFYNAVIVLWNANYYKKLHDEGSASKNEADG